MSANIRKIAIVGGAIAVLGGIGFIIYAIVWALNSKLGKSLAPYLGFVNSILASLAAHPVEWIALIGLGIAAVVAAPIIYQVAKYVRERQVLKKSMQAANEEVTETAKKPFTDEAIEEMDLLSSKNDFARADVVMQARALQSLPKMNIEDREKLATSERLLTEQRAFSKLMEDSYREKVKGSSEEDISEARNGWTEGLKLEEAQVKESAALHLSLFDKYVK